MNKKLFTIILLICLIVVIIDFLLTYRFINDFFYTLGERRDHLLKIYQYENYLSKLKDVERSQRGYIITGNEKYLYPYEQSISYFDSPEKNFLYEDRDAEDKIKEINQLEKKKLKVVENSIKVMKEKGFKEAQAIVDSNEGENLMSALIEQINSIIEKKQKTLVLLDSSIKSKMQETIRLLIISNSVAGISILLFLFYLAHTLSKLKKSKKKLSSTLQKLNESNAFRDAILTSTNYAVLSTDTEGTIALFNPAAEKMLGYKADELIGKEKPTIFHVEKEIEDRAIELSKQFHQKILPGPDVFTFLASKNIRDIHEWTFIKKDGSKIPVKLGITSAKNEENKIIGYVGIFTDMTDRKAILKLKNELISITGHELRSPLAAIKGSFDLLGEQGHLSIDKVKHIIEIGKSNCKLLSKLIEDLLEMQKLELGEVQLNYKKIIVKNFIEKVLLYNKNIAEKNHINLQCEHVSQEIVIDGDEDRLLRVANNLIENAIKYSRERGTVKISVTRDDRKIRFEICDEGPGIPQDFQTKIFQKFSWDTSFIDDNKKSTSLGLSIAKTIVEKHKGNIGFFTNSKGTTFWFEIPIHSASDT